MDLDSDSDSKSDSEYSFNSNDELNINSELSLGLVKCNSLAFLQNYEKYIHLEFSNNIILPHQYLNEIQNSYGSLEFPLYFELKRFLLLLNFFLLLGFFFLLCGS